MRAQAVARFVGWFVPSSQARLTCNTKEWHALESLGSVCFMRWIIISVLAFALIAFGLLKFRDNESVVRLRHRLLSQLTSLNAAIGWARVDPEAVRLVAVQRGATIPELTGSAAGIPWADTNPAHFGHYDAPGGSLAGYPLIGGPLLDDLQAVSFIKPTQKSKPELGPSGPAIAAANNYFNYIASTNPEDYLRQLRSFYADYVSGWGRSWQPVADRIDGACPLAHPTTAEVLQWAANKWGINPLLMYAEAENESHWDQTGIGDNGRSSGLMQVPDRDRPHHGYPGFGGLGAMLARENSCFNADFFAGRIYSIFHGLSSDMAPGGDIGIALQSWYSGHTNSAGPYTAAFIDTLTNRLWVSREFDGIAVPY